MQLLAHSLPAELGNSDLEVQREMYQALSYARLGQLAVAATALERAQALADRTHSQVQDELFSIRGIVALQNDDNVVAEALFRRGLALARERRDTFLESTLLLNLGVVALHREHYDEALSWSNAASRIAREIDAQLVLEKALANVGWDFFKLGDFEKALSNFEQAEEEARRLGAIYDQAEWLNDAGLAELQLGNTAAAGTSYKKALTAAEQLQNRQEMLEAELELAVLFFDEQRFDESQASCASAMHLADSIGTRSLRADPLLVDGLLLAHKGETAEAIRIFSRLEHDAQTPPSRRWEIENALANVYNQTHDFRSSERWYRRSIETFEEQRANLSTDELKLSFFTNGTDLYREYADFLIARHQAATALELVDLGRARTLQDGLGLSSGKFRLLSQHSVNPQAVAGRLNATILFYSLAPRRSYLWAVSAHRTLLIPLPAEMEIERHIRSYQRFLLQSGDPLRLGNEDALYLYKTLVAPAQPLIARNSTVVVIPDGGLYGFNFETLLTSAGSGRLHYWIEDVTLTTTPSLRVLSASPPEFQPPGPKKILLIGDPISHGEDYPALTNASLEIADVRRHFSNLSVVSLTGAKATPAAYQANRPGGYAYVHFVAHGTASRLSPLDSAVILSGPPAQPDEFKLYARDIVQQRLSAELVTISACYGSGTRVYAGEGLVGLAWAFLRAGSHNVIGALWPVSDASTPALMDKMYSELEEGRPPMVALRDAKLALLHSPQTFRKPLYWAAFQLYTGAFKTQD